MAYEINDIIELIHYHLVLGSETDVAADASLTTLVDRIEELMVRRPHHFVDWMTCDGCGGSECIDLVDRAGTGWARSGAFYCASCRRGGV